MALRHIALRTRDLAGTRCSYVDLLGLREAFPHPGMLFLESPGGGDLLNFVEVRKPIDPKGAVSITSAFMSRPVAFRRSGSGSRPRA